MAKEQQGEVGHVVSVVRQEGQTSLVAVPMVGFPEGFQLAPGARVVLVSTPSGPAVRPLVRAMRAEVPRDVLETRGELTVGDRRMTLQDATVIGEQPRAEESSDEDLVWVVDSTDKEGPEQVIAVRLGSRERP
jgi:hypothetical protein